MFTVLPRGRTKRTARLSTRFSRAHSMVMGSVADELAVPKAIRIARNRPTR